VDNYWFADNIILNVNIIWKYGELFKVNMENNNWIQLAFMLKLKLTRIIILMSLFIGMLFSILIAFSKEARGIGIMYLELIILSVYFCVLFLLTIFYLFKDKAIARKLFFSLIMSVAIIMVTNLLGIVALNLFN